MRAALAEPGMWHVLRLCSLSTLFREYIAVHSLGKAAFAGVLLSAQAPPKPAQQSLVIPQVWQHAGWQGCLAICAAVVVLPCMLPSFYAGKQPTAYLLLVVCCVMQSQVQRVLKAALLSVHTQPAQHCPHCRCVKAAPAD